MAIRIKRDWLAWLTLASGFAAPAASIVSGVANPFGYENPGIVAYLLLPLSLTLLVVMLGWLQLAFAAFVKWLRVPVLKIAAAAIAIGMAVAHAVYASAQHDLGYSVASAMAPFWFPMSFAVYWSSAAVVLGVADRLMRGPRHVFDPSSPWSRPPQSLGHEEE